MKIDVVIPTLARDSLREAYKSCSSKDINNIFICVDEKNSSLVSKIIGDSSNYTLLISERIDGPSKRNLGIQRCTSDFFVCLDDDDELILSNELINQLKDLDNDKDCIGLAGSVVITNSKNKVTRVNSKKNRKIYLNNLIFVNHIGTTSSVFLKTDYVKSNSIFFNPFNLCRQDFDYWFSLLERGKSIKTTELITLRYNDGHGYDQTSKQKFSKKIPSILNIYLRHFRKRKIFIFSILNHLRYLAKDFLKK